MSVGTKRLTSSSGPLVIGAGLMRTGTNSQMKALEILLGGRCYHMEVIMTEKRHHLKLWRKAAEEGLTKELADEILDGFVAATDYPTAHFYPELMNIYPNAKFILSIRDPKRWVESVRATIIEVTDKTRRLLLRPVAWLTGMSEYHSLMRSMQPRMENVLECTDEEMMRIFDRHTQAVMRTIPKDRLLVFRVTDGWEPLCKFLDLPVPDVPFPNVNDTAHFRRRTQLICLAGCVLNAAFCGLVGAAVWQGAKFCLKKWA